MIRLIQRKMAKKTTNWKTKEVDGRRMMICQNSKPTMSKYSEFAPEDGDCTEWSEVSHDTTGSLCWRCTARSVNNIRLK
jgi:hypothetical protein|tara:strand:- start:3269 stop:3505 length:237 start_codon:yes stop_codon:yes gene_type:complete